MAFPIFKKSRYNILFEHKGEKFAFNSFTTALNKVNDDFINILNSIGQIFDEEKTENQQLISDMIKEGYLINDDFDELKALQFYNLNKKFNNDTFSLTLAPTLSCNFDCPYCYESAKHGTMGSAVKDKLLEFVEKNLKNKKYLNISWFGGEPLLAKEIIYDLSCKFIALCEKLGVEYSAKMVSNFYLADKETINNLKKHKVTQVQVTIDGSEKIHNTRRKLKNSSEPTFNKILDNIGKSKEIGIPIIIRINADKTNIDSIGELVDILSQRNLKDCYIYLGHTTIFDECCPTKFSKECFTNSDFAVQSIDFAKLLAEKGFKNIVNVMYPTVVPFHCSAECLNAFIVGPSGELYKCENEIGETEKCVGSIFHDNNSHAELLGTKEAMAGMNWLLCSPFEDKICRDCNVLPLCMGGCSIFKKKLLKPYCMPWKYNLIDTLKLKCHNYQLTKEKSDLHINVC